MNRDTIFDDIRRARGGRKFTTQMVRDIDDLLDRLEVPGDTLADTFTAALDEILHHEGGYANHPADPGGRTNLGVTQRVWEQWTGKPSNEAEMRSLTRSRVAPLYRKNYWDAVEGDKLPPALALCVFDFAVNAGPHRAARFLQGMVGAAADGKIGPQTLAAVTGFIHRKGLIEAVKLYQEMRRDYYRSLGTFKTFGKGWLRRVAEVEARALEMAG
jgi:lysozyme family protein